MPPLAGPEATPREIADSVPLARNFGYSVISIPSLHDTTRRKAIFIPLAIKLRAYSKTRN
jgi:hypothetical protein